MGSREGVPRARSHKSTAVARSPVEVGAHGLVPGRFRVGGPPRPCRARCRPSSSHRKAWTPHRSRGGRGASRAKGEGPANRGPGSVTCLRGRSRGCAAVPAHRRGCPPRARRGDARSRSSHPGHRDRADASPPGKQPSPASRPLHEQRSGGSPTLRRRLRGEQRTLLVVAPEPAGHVALPSWPITHPLPASLFRSWFTTTPGAVSAPSLLPRLAPKPRAAVRR